MANRDRARAWCFTWNNYSNSEFAVVKTWIETNCKYGIVGQEIGESGTPHLQGYLEFKIQKDFSALKKALPKVHLEKRKGTAKQAADYCKKDGVFWEHGDCSEQGKRTDLEEVAAEVLKGTSMKELAVANPSMFVKYHKGLQVLRTVTLNHRDPKVPPKVIWRWGLAGAGKTRWVFDNFDINDVYSKGNHKWWDGYSQQPVILIDDFASNKWEFRELLMLLDRFPYSGEIKGGMVPINSGLIIITCEFPPHETWKEGNELNQVLRRITEVVHVLAPGPSSTSDVSEVSKVLGNTKARTSEPGARTFPLGDPGPAEGLAPGPSVPTSCVGGLPLLEAVAAAAAPIGRTAADAAAAPVEDIKISKAAEDYIHRILNPEEGKEFRCESPIKVGDHGTVLAFHLYPNDDDAQDLVEIDY